MSHDLGLLPRENVGNHGRYASAYQDGEFLDAVAAEVVVVTVGEDNRYGHPDAGVLAGLRRDGARILRTDVHGDVAVVRRGDGLAVMIRGSP